MICVSLAQGPQHKLKNTLLCSVQAEVEHLHRAWSSSSHMFHLSPKIFLTIAVVHHCQHFHPCFNSDTSLDATIKHTCPRNTFPTRLTYGSDFPSLPRALFSSASWTKTVLSRPSAILFLFHSYWYRNMLLFSPFLLHQRTLHFYFFLLSFFGLDFGDPLAYLWGGSS